MTTNRGQPSARSRRTRLRVDVDLAELTKLIMALTSLVVVILAAR